MSNIDGLNRATPGALPRRPSTGSGELAKLETQLSDWVHCPSSKTSAGKAKIAEITAKIDSIKVQVKKAEDQNGKANVASAPQSPGTPAVRSLRFDGRGAWLNEVA